MNGPELCSIDVDSEFCSMHEEYFLCDFVVLDSGEWKYLLVKRCGEFFERLAVNDYWKIFPGCNLSMEDVAPYFQHVKLI